MKIEYLWPCKCVIEKDECVTVFDIRIPRCSRCLGFHIGLFISIIVILLGYISVPKNPLLFMVLGILLSLPTVIQGVYRRYYDKGKGGIHELIAFISGFLVAIGALIFALGFIPYLK